MESSWKKQVNDLKTILMKLRGPLQSYGTDSHFEIRHTEKYPSKSAILGLIAAAMGIRREEMERLQELRSLNMMIRVDQNGQISRDFQTAKKLKKTGEFERNYVTYRYYLEDAIFLVALEGEDSLMERIYQALKRPYFPLFLGRRACPVNFDFLMGIYEEDAFAQITERPWFAAEWYQKSFKKQEKVRLDIYGDMQCLPEGRQKALRRDNTISFSQMGRQYNLRFEVHENIWIENPCFIKMEKETEHDAFGALLGG